MKTPGSTILIFAGLVVMAIGFANRSASLFIPIPAAFAPVTEFGCPDAGTIFTYNVPAWNTNRPNRMVVIEQDQFNCRIRSDAQGTYDWFGGLGPHLDSADAAEKQLITDLWPLRSGSLEKTSKYGVSRYGEIEYAVSYGLARVPAGLFGAYKIRIDYYRQNNLYRTNTLWWSPSLKWTIRQWPEQPGTVSQVGGFNWELLSVSSR